MALTNNHYVHIFIQFQAVSHYHLWLCKKNGVWCIIRPPNFPGSNKGTPVFAAFLDVSKAGVTNVVPQAPLRLNGPRGLPAGLF